MQTMVRAVIRDIEAIRAGLPPEKRKHSEIVLRHLNQALRDLVPQGAVVIRFDRAARRVRAQQS
jgi:hypothetical protein